MKWNDRAIILSSRKFGESSMILNVLTENHGLYSGVIKAAKSKSVRGLYEQGNIVQATWNARLAEHLGMLGAEMISAVAARVMGDSVRLAGLVSACHLLSVSLQEREPHPEIFVAMLSFLDSVQDEEGNWRKEYVILELELLKRLGFGMDLATCVATGINYDLAYVSPKSGRAVSKAAGEKYRDKLLRLPPFIIDENSDRPEKEDILHGMRLTGYFLDKHVFAEDNRASLKVRARFIEMLKVSY